MDWDVSYTVSRSLSLEISPKGQLVGRASVSRRPQAMELDALPVLTSFAPAATPRAVFERLIADWDVQEEGFATVVDGLLAQGFLIPVQAGAEGVRVATAFDSVITHHHMLRDVIRVMAYKAAIDRNCRDKSVVEIGCGTGVLSIFAARAGARSVVAIEEGEIANLAEKMFQANGCEGTIALRRANSLDVALEEPADLVIHEIIGVDPLGENVLRYIQDARSRLLRPGGRMLPYRLEVLCAGVEIESRPGGDKLQALAEVTDFALLYGIDFTPYREMLSRNTVHFRPPMITGEQQRFPLTLLSQECLLLDFDFYGEAPALDSEAHLRIHRSGNLGGIVLYFRAHLDEETRLTNSPFAPMTSWGWDTRRLSREIQVQEGDTVALKVQVSTIFGQQAMSVSLAEG